MSIFIPFICYRVSFIAAEAIAEAEKLPLTGNHFYYTLLGELYKTTDMQKAKDNFEKALSLAKTPADKQTIQAKTDSINGY